MKKQLSFALMIGALSFYGCSKKDEPQVTENLPDRSAAIAEPSIAEGPVQIGVDICDSFLEKYRVCVAKLPDRIRGSMQKGLDKTEVAWRAAVERSKDQSALKESCEKMESSISKSMKSQGCTW